MKCLNCFNECREGLFFCNICGSPLLSEEVVKETMNHTTASVNTANTVHADRINTTASSTHESVFGSGVPYTASNEQKIKSTAEAIPADEKKDFDITDIKMPVIPIMPKQENETYKNGSNAEGTDTIGSKANAKSSNGQATQNTEYPPLKKEATTEAHERLEKMLEKDDKTAKILTRGQFVAMELLLYVPIINIILLLLWSFNKNGNPNRRNYAIAKLICIPLLALFFIILAVAMYATGMFDSIIASLETYLV